MKRTKTPTWPHVTNTSVEPSKMPLSNILIVSGDTKIQKKFDTKVKRRSLLSLNPQPIPDKLTNADGVNESFAWRMQNWGIHGEFVTVQAHHTKKTLIYSFLTSHIPLPWLATVSKDIFPHMTFMLESNNKDINEGLRIYLKSGEIMNRALYSTAELKLHSAEWYRNELSKGLGDKILAEVLQI